MNSEVIKHRRLLDPRALQMLREPGAARLAAEAVPTVINGVTVIFPNMAASAGRDVSLRSNRLQGRSVEDMIWDPACQEFALDMGIIALQALARADLTCKHLTWLQKTYLRIDLALFSALFEPVRTLKVGLSERLGTALLSNKEQSKLIRLVRAYMTGQEKEKKVLVHGDLHAGNLIADIKRKTLAFIDLEMMHIGKPATNFAQLWVSYSIADALLGRKFYEYYAREMPETVDAHFDLDVRAELGLRCHALALEGRKTGNAFLERTASALLHGALNIDSFERICYTSRDLARD